MNQIYRSLILVIVGGLVAPTVTPAGPAQYRTGFRPAAESDGSVAIERISGPRPGMRSLPASVLNIEHLPVVRAQGLNNCGAFAPSYYYKTYQEAREHGWTRPDPAVNPERVMSPGFTYPLVNYGVDAGANSKTTMEAICRYGIAPWSVLPESLSYDAMPNEAAWRAAHAWRGDHVIEYDVSTPTGIAALKQHLAAGDLAVIAVHLYYDTYNSYGTGAATSVSNDVIYDKGLNFWDAHAFTLIGYDDNKGYTEAGVAKQGAFLAVNSWGPDWGIAVAQAGSRGFCWFSYDFVQSRRGGNTGGACAMADRTAYQPEEVAVVDMALARRNLQVLKIQSGGTAEPQSKPIPAFPVTVGTQSYAGRVVLDVTELMGGDPLTYTLTQTNHGDYYGVEEGAWIGEVTDFHVEKASGARVRSIATSEAPIAIVSQIDSSLQASPLAPAEAPLVSTTDSLKIAWCDFNRDGMIDLAVTGSNLISGRQARVYQQYASDGSGMVDLELGLPGMLQGAIAWGDYDRDGFADLALAGETTGPDQPVVKIYRNAGMGRFADSGIALPGWAGAQLAWGDYDNDTRPDLLLLGYDQGASAWKTRLYRNTGAALTDSGIALPARRADSLCWVDADNDGRLDLSIGGRLLRNNGNSFTEVWAFSVDNSARTAWADFDADGRVDAAVSFFDFDLARRINTEIHRNLGGFQFALAAGDLAGAYDGALDWGDFDNDGRPDVAYGGYATAVWDNAVLRVYRQVEPGVFRNLGLDAAGSAAGGVGWADLNRDGALDLLAAGHSGVSGMMFAGTTALYMNDAASSGGLNRANQPPSAPGNLRVAWAQSALELRWNAASDDLTTAAGLGYRLRVGTRPGMADVIAPEADGSPWTGHAHAMDAVGAPRRIVRGLAAGRYYWSVQAVDAGRAGGAWSPEQSFTFGGAGLLDGDANGDGRIDVADVVTVQRMVDRQTSPVLARADLNVNGVVDALDTWSIVARLLGEAEAGFMPMEQGLIQPWGGQVGSAARGLELTVAPGGFPSAATLTLEAGVGTPPRGIDATLPAWRVRGLPKDGRSAMTLRLNDLRDDKTNATAWLAIGIEGFAQSIGERVTGYRMIEATRMADGRLEAQLSLPGVDGEAAGPTLAGADEELAKYDFTFVIYLLKSSQWRYEGGHFKIVGPVGTKDQLPALAKDLEDAYAYCETTLGFDLKRRDWTHFPVEVTVMELGKGSDGEPVQGYSVGSTSYDGLKLEINTSILGNANLRRTTVAHEFFHIVQALQDSRGGMARGYTAPNLWLDDATATWIEMKFAAQPNFIPNVVKAYKAKVFDGYAQAESIWSATRQNYGYGLSQLIEHLVQRNGGDPKILQSIYGKIRNGGSGLHALETSAPGYPMSEWYTSFFESVIQEKLYPGLWQFMLFRNEIAGKPWQKNVETERERGMQFPPFSLGDLAAKPAYIYVNPTGWTPTPEDKLGFQVSAEQPLDFALSALHFTNQGAGGPKWTKLGTAVHDSESDAMRLEVANAAQWCGARNWLVPIVVNVDDTIPYNDPQEARLSFGIYRDYDNRAIQPHACRLATVSDYGGDLGWPIFTSQGSYTLHDVTLLQEGYLTATSNTIPGIIAYLWSDPPPPMRFKLTVTPPAGAYDEVQGDGRRIVLSGIAGVRFRTIRYKAEVVGPFNMQMTPDGTGPWRGEIDFTFEIGKEEQGCVTMIEMEYSYHKTVYNSSGIKTFDEDQTRSGRVFNVALLRARR